MHQRLEIAVIKIGNYSFNHPLRTIIAMLLLSFLSFLYVPQLKTEQTVPEKQDALTQAFGADDSVIVGLQSDAIFTLDFFTLLQSMHEELESNLSSSCKIHSLYNVRYTRSVGEKLLSDNLLVPFPKTEQEVQKVKKQILTSHFYKNLFISPDGKMTAIILERNILSHKDDTKTTENTQFIDTVEQITKRYAQKGLQISIADSALTKQTIALPVQENLPQMMATTFIISILLLWMMFRRWSAAAFTMLVVSCALLASLGIATGTSGSFVSLSWILLYSIIAASMSMTVQLLGTFFDTLDAGGDPKEALRDTLKHSGVSIVLFSLLAVIALLVFANSDVVAVFQLGVHTAFGVLVSMVLSLTLLPALLGLVVLSPKKTTQTSLLSNLMCKLSIVPMRYFRSIVIVGIFMTILLAVIAFKIEPAEYISSEQNPSAQAIDTALNGSVNVQLFIDAKKENAWHDPARLEKLNLLSMDFENYVDEVTRVGKVVCLCDILKETNKALHQNQEKFYTIPQSAEAIAQTFFLFENSGSDNLQDVVDSSFSQTRMTIKLPSKNIMKATQALKYIEEQARKTFPQDTISLTGMLPLSVTSFSYQMDELFEGYLRMFAVLTLMLMIVLGTFRLGIFGILPLLATASFGLLVVYAADISLDWSSLFIGLVAIIIALANTINFMYNLKRHYKENKDTTLAMDEVFKLSGKTMIMTAIVLLFAFYAAMTTEAFVAYHLGVLMGGMIIFALIIGVVLAPALMMFALRYGWIR